VYWFDLSTSPASEFVQSEFVQSEFDSRPFVQSEFVQSEFVQSEFVQSEFDSRPFVQSEFVQSEFEESPLDQTSGCGVSDATSEGLGEGAVPEAVQPVVATTTMSTAAHNNGK
jgi:hypothetical protein